MLILPVSTKNESRRFPYACVVLILLNILVFLLLQSGDGARLREAAEYYRRSGLATIEAKAYRTYLAGKGETVPQELPAKSGEIAKFLSRMAADDEFGSLLEKNLIIRPGNPIFTDWREKRYQFESLEKRSTSSNTAFRRDAAMRWRCSRICSCTAGSCIWPAIWSSSGWSGRFWRLRSGRCSSSRSI